jgi:hypothetical protein
VLHAATWLTWETFKDATAGVASITTALALLVGGVWAWFKFIRGRIFNPRITTELLGQWRSTDEVKSRIEVRTQRPPVPSHVLHVRVRVTNISAAKVLLRQYYTALYVSFLSEHQPRLPGTVEWENHLATRTEPSNQGAFVIFKEHSWVEPDESITDDLLLELGRRPTTVRLELYLAWNSSLWLWQRRWKTWRRAHRWVLKPRVFCRNRCRPAYRWGERTRGVRTLLRPIYGLVRWRRRCRRKRRRWMCRSRLYRWVYRRPDDPRHRKDVADFVRRIIPIDSTQIDDDDA